jgi:electron transport complex protein RnfE
MPEPNANSANAARKRSWASGALLQNPLLAQAIGLTPVVAASTTVYAALWISGLSALHILVCEALAAAALKKLPEWLRVGIYCAIGLGLACPVTYWLNQGGAPASAALRMFLPLMALSSMTAARCERFAVTHTVGESLGDAAANALGFTLVAVLAGTVREALGQGSLLGHGISRHLHIRGFWMPFGGFLLLGAMAALLKAVLRRMASRGIYTGAEVAMELAPEDRQARLEKSRQLRMEEEKEAAGEASPESPAEPPSAESGEDAPPALSEEDRLRLRQTIDELLEDL